MVVVVVIVVVVIVVVVSDGLSDFLECFVNVFGRVGVVGVMEYVNGATRDGGCRV